ncbi:MAG: hypothetical protein MJ231_04505 [bacterium]|nr:hypothetical protein [bacterium]
MYFFEGKEEPKFRAKSVEHAYLAILSDDLITAKKIFESNDSPRNNWGQTLVQVLNGRLLRVPTYFELRNFLEIDLDYLIKNEKVEYTQLLLGASDIFIRYNQEVYKYIGRVLFSDRYFNLAKEYFDKSKSVMYNDAELHFLLAEFYINNREYNNALQSIDACLKIFPSYFPAIKLRNQISKFI